MRRRQDVEEALVWIIWTIAFCLELLGIGERWDLAILIPLLIISHYTFGIAHRIDALKS